MRLIVGVLACVAASAVTLAVADPPPAPAAAPSATASATPTPAATPAAASATPVVDDDRALRAAGYKPQMKGGQKMWCRKEEVTTGTRLSRDKESCNTPEALKEQIKNGREITERAQNNQMNKSGN